MRGTLNRPSGVDLGCDAQNRHCERPKTARQSRVAVTALDCFAPLAMTKGWVLSQQFLNLFPQLFRLRGRRMPRYDLSFAVHQEFGEIPFDPAAEQARSEEHTSELQSLMRISNAVFCLKKKKTHTTLRIY